MNAKLRFTILAIVLIHFTLLGFGIIGAPFFLEYPEFVFAYIGALMNLLVMALNKWKMPVYIPYTTKALKTKHHQEFKTRKEIRGFFLCDRFHLLRPADKDYPDVKIFSLGDVLLYFGVAATLIHLIFR